MYILVVGHVHVNRKQQLFFLPLGYRQTYYSKSTVFTGLIFLTLLEVTSLYIAHIDTSYLNVLECCYLTHMHKGKVIGFICLSPVIHDHKNCDL